MRAEGLPSSVVFSIVYVVLGTAFVLGAGDELGLPASMLGEHSVQGDPLC